MNIKERLDGLANINKIARIPIVFDNINILLQKALREFKNAERNLIYYEQKERDEYSETVFKEFYESFRLLCLSILSSLGYKPTSKGGGHYYTITFGQDIILDYYKKQDIKKCDELKIIFNNIDRIERKRNTAMYDPIVMDVPWETLNKLRDDIKIFLKYAGHYIAGFRGRKGG